MTISAGRKGGNMFAVFGSTNDANRKGLHMSGLSPSSPERRSFFTAFNAGVTSLAALALGGVAMAKPKSAARWEPARHDKDDWMDSLAGKHRMVIDTTSADGFRNGLLFASNFILANHNDYGLQNQDLAIIVVARHLSTGYAFNNDMWAKYGGSLTSEPASADPQAKAPKANPSAAS